MAKKWEGGNNNIFLVPFLDSCHILPSTRVSLLSRFLFDYISEEKKCVRVKRERLLRILTFPGDEKKCMQLSDRFELRYKRGPISEPSYFSFEKAGKLSYL